MLTALRSAFLLPELRKKILFTLGILLLYRVLAQIPVPGVDREALGQIMQHDLANMFDMLSGGALSRFSIMAMGVYPYITASIIMQLLVPIIPKLEEIAKDGDAGRQKINQYTTYLTIPLALLQGFGTAALMSGGTFGTPILPRFGFTTAPLLTLGVLIALLTGSFIALWLGNLITQDGVGNGVSLIIFGGIVSQMWPRINALLASTNGVFLTIIFAIVTIATVFLIVYVQEGQRRIPVRYGKRVRTMRGNRLMMVGGQSSYIPIRVNSAGMIPLIFASTLLIFPSTVASAFVNSSVPWLRSIAEFLTVNFSIGSTAYWIAYFILVVAFTFFYTAVIFQQQNIPESLQRQGGYIPGIRPGKRTEEYLNKVVNRITLVGALFLGFVAILPWLVSLVLRQPSLSNSALLITSAGLLIVVGVVLDTMKQLEAQLLMRHYEGFIK
ncbi:MAG TPA: preprotein translocase subunit SecY [Anaerolineae bacterium]|nr:preprotein translocase subunit SecY [Anaerolineae bacterium]